MESECEQVTTRASSDTFFPFVILTYLLDKEKNGERHLEQNLLCAMYGVQKLGGKWLQWAKTAARQAEQCDTFMNHCLKANPNAWKQCKE